MADTDCCPVILDTDIGTDVDDAFALALAALHPRVNLIAVTTVLGDTLTRARLAKQLLAILGRPEVPVAAGARTGMTGLTGWWGGWEEADLEDPRASEEEIDSDAPALIVESVRRTHGKTTVVAIGSLTNVAQALRQFPEIAQSIEVVAMGGCARPVEIGGIPLPPEVETNLSNDPEAARIVLNSGVPVRLVPADVTFRMRLLGSDLERIRSAGPHGALLAKMTDRFHPYWHASMQSRGIHTYYADTVALMHDPLTLLAAVQPLTYSDWVLTGQEGSATMKPEGLLKPPNSVHILASADEIIMRNEIVSTITSTK